MHTVDIPAFAGIGFLAIGAMLSVSDLALFETPYALILGPISWIVGCALMIAWAIGHVGLAVTRGSDLSDESSALKEEMPAQRRPANSEATAAGSDRGAVDGHSVADFLIPLAIWLMVLWFLASIVLLLGSEAG